MKKNFRKTPEFILNRIQAVNSDNIVLAVVFNVKKDDINDKRFKNIGLEFANGKIRFKNKFIPNSRTGTFSRRNIEGYKIVYKDREKISKTFYLGERPIFGDWSKGSFSMYQTRKVYPYDKIPPRELAIQCDLLSETPSDFKIKVSVDIVLDKNDNDFDKELFFAMNLLQENIYEVNVFSAHTTREEYLKTLALSWDIFPPGKRDDDLKKIIGTTKKLSPDKVKNIENKYDYLVGLNPNEIISGISGMRRYFGAKFSNNLVVFENLNYGNAIYVLFENWEALSKLSRTDIQKRPSNEFIRIKHTTNWKKKLERIIAKRR